MNARVIRLPVRDHHVVDQRPDWLQPSCIQCVQVDGFSRGVIKGRTQGYWRGFRAGVIYSVAFLTLGIVCAHALGGFA